MNAINVDSICKKIDAHRISVRSTINMHACMHALMLGTDNFHDLHHCSRYQYLKTDKIIIIASDAHWLTKEHATCEITRNITELKLPSLTVWLNF